MDLCGGFGFGRYSHAPAGQSPICEISSEHVHACSLHSLAQDTTLTITATLLSPSYLPFSPSSPNEGFQYP